jgi:transposase
MSSRYDPTLKTFRQRLEAAGKLTRVAITAWARKLFTILDAMIRDGKD